MACAIFLHVRASERSEITLLLRAVRRVEFQRVRLRAGRSQSHPTARESEDAMPNYCAAYLWYLRFTTVIFFYFWVLTHLTTTRVYMSHVT